MTDYQYEDLQMELDKSSAETLRILSKIECKIRNDENVDDELVLLTINLQRLSDYFSDLRSDIINIIDYEN